MCYNILLNKIIAKDSQTTLDLALNYFENLGIFFCEITDAPKEKRECLELFIKEYRK